MKIFLLSLIFGVALGGEMSRVSVRMPYQNPAGVLYRTYPTLVGPQSNLLAGTAPLLTVPRAQATPLLFTQYHAPNGYLPRYVHTPTPLVTARRYRLRRPAVHKQFYDVEERVEVKPAGAALLELDPPVHEPVGPTPLPVLSQPLTPFHQSFVSLPFGPTPVALPQPLQPVSQELGPIDGPTTVSSPPTSLPASTTPPPRPSSPQFDDSDSVAVENPDFARSQTEPRAPEDSPLQSDPSPRTVQEENPGQAASPTLVRSPGPDTATRSSGPHSASYYHQLVMGGVLEVDDVPRGGFTTRRVVVSRPTETVREVEEIRPYGALKPVLNQEDFPFYYV